MRVLVCGSRSWADPEPVRRRLALLPKDSTVIHGGALGADTLAGEAAQRFRLEQRVFRPNWRRFGRRAGVLRNLEMLDQEPDLVVAFWDGRSRGTRHTISEAVKRGIRVEVVSP